MNILFVCRGNVSRSYLAEMLLKNELDHRHMAPFSVSSAGLLAYPGSPPDPQMVDFLKGLGIIGDPHQSKQLERKDAKRADLILVMEKEQAFMIERMWPETKKKIALLSGFISKEEPTDDIRDPAGASPYHYRLVQSQITLAVQGLVDSLSKECTKAPNAQD